MLDFAFADQTAGDIGDGYGLHLKPLKLEIGMAENIVCCAAHLAGSTKLTLDAGDSILLVVADRCEIYHNYVLIAPVSLLIVTATSGYFVSESGRYLKMVSGC